MSNIIPFYLMILHQCISNSVIGFANPWLSKEIILLMMLTMVIFLYNQIGLKLHSLGAFLFLIISVLIWSVMPKEFAILGNVGLVLFIAYFVFELNGLFFLRNQLFIIIFVSFVLSLMQISGVFEWVHLWNSQFIDVESVPAVMKLELTNILLDPHNEEIEFDSRQVRPSGLFHSSAVLALACTIYISFVYSGLYKRKFHLYFIPWLTIFVGSKLVVIYWIFCTAIGIGTRRINRRTFLFILFNFLTGLGMEFILFPYLLYYQFGFEVMYTSIDSRTRLYFDTKFVEFLEMYPILSSGFAILAAGSIFMTLFGTIALLKRKPNYHKNTLIYIGIILSLITTLQPGNLLYGFLFIPALLWNPQSQFALKNRIGLSL